MLVVAAFTLRLVFVSVECDNTKNCDGTFRKVPATVDQILHLTFNPEALKTYSS